MKTHTWGKLICFAAVAFVLAGILSGEALAQCPAGTIRYTKGPEIKPLLVIAWDPLRRAPDDVRPSIDQIKQIIFAKTSLGQSVSDYYFRQSGGKANVSPIWILGWFTSKYPADHYWNHPAYRSDGTLFDEFSTPTGGDGHAEKWAEAIRMASNQFTFPFFDSNCDGELSPDELAILILIPQAQAFGTNRFTVGNAKGARLSVGGIKFQSIVEVYTGTDASGVPLNFGVTAHELGHLIFNFQDLYPDSPSSGQGGPYSLMDSSYNDSLIDPWQKIQQGWMSVANVTVSGTYWVRNSQVSNQVLKVSMPKRCRISAYGLCIMYSFEYALVEYRLAYIYDRQLPTNGLAIWNYKSSPSTGIARLDTNIVNVNGLLNIGSNLKVPYRDGTPSSVTITPVRQSGDWMLVDVRIP